MNPVTYNDRFQRAIAEHPAQKEMAKQLNGWHAAPLFDYETDWDKETALISQQEGVTLEHVLAHQWPFDTLRIAMVERRVPMREGDPNTQHHDYFSDYVAKKHDNETVDMLIYWRNYKGAPGRLMLHVFTYKDDTGHHTAACLYAPERGGWDLRRIPTASVEKMAGSAIAAFCSFIIDCSLPSNHVAEVRPNKAGKSVEWTKARTHFTLISHGHPANSKNVAELQHVSVDREGELKRMSGNRRGHWRTYKHERYTYARNQTRWIKQTWCGPKEWIDAGSKQIYRVLEPVAA